MERCRILGTGYEPIRDASNNIIGVLLRGLSKEVAGENSIRASDMGTAQNLSGNS